MAIKAWCRIAAVITLVFFLVSVVPSVARPWQDEELQEELQDSVDVFMQAKLSHMQEIIKGLTTEDMPLVAKNSQKISQLSLVAQWQVIQTPEYVQRSAEFRRLVDNLTEVARQGNLDGATLAYLKVTLNCIECHKYVREVRQVRGPVDPLLPRNS